MSDRKHRRQLGMADFLKAAFNIKISVPGIGGIPVNWAFMALVGGLTIAAWPLGLIGGSIELAYLMSMSSSLRFQRVVRSQMGDLAHEDGEREIETILGRGMLYQNYEAFAKWCEEVVSIAEDTMGKDDSSGILASYKDNLFDLRMIYAKLLRIMQNIQCNISKKMDSDLEEKLATYQGELAELPENHPAEERISLQGTIDIIIKRIEMQKQLQDRLQITRGELRRLDEQIRLIKDQVILSKDPSVLSANLTVATTIIDTHSAWMRDNQILIQQ